MVATMDQSPLACVRCGYSITAITTAFQAEDVGSIPSTRSKLISKEINKYVDKKVVDKRSQLQYYKYS